MNSTTNLSFERITGLLFSGFMTKLYAVTAAVYISTEVVHSLAAAMTPLKIALGAH